MKNDFKRMEDEMDGLAANMAAITESSARVSSTLRDRHEQIAKLSGRGRGRGGQDSGLAGPGGQQGR